MCTFTTNVTPDLDSDVTVVRATGVLSLLTAPAMRAVLLACVAGCPSAVVVDVTGCVAENPAALAVLPAVALHRAARPPVAVLLCGADDGFLRNGGLAALGPVARYGTCAEALSAAEDARRTRQRKAVRIPRSREAPRSAREEVAQVCDTWGLDHMRIPALLIVSELATNAIWHAGSDVDLEVTLRDDYLHLRMRDTSPLPPVLPAQPRAATLRDHGRGMAVVAHYSTAWGYVIDSAGAGKVVWATLYSRPREFAGAQPG